MKYAKAKIKLVDPHGFHMRPAGRCTIAVAKLDANISMSAKCRTVSGRWPLRFPMYPALSLRLRCGDEVLVSAVGLDAEEAVSTIKAILEEPPTHLPDVLTDYYGTKNLGVNR